MQGISIRTRLLAVAAATAATALALTGCAANSGHQLGDGVVTKLNGSDFTGTIEVKATKVERVTNAALSQMGLSGKGDTAYFAHATLKVDKGTFPASAAADFGNASWGLQAGGSLQAGPSLKQSDRSSLLQDACPYEPTTIAKQLRAGGTAKVCAVLLAPKGSTVTAVSYLRAAPTDGQTKGDATITWTASA